MCKYIFTDNKKAIDFLEKHGYILEDGYKVYYTDVFEEISWCIKNTLGKDDLYGVEVKVVTNFDGDGKEFHKFLSKNNLLLSQQQ